MNKILLVEEYAENFSNKKIDLLKQMFSQDIELTDWEISAKGIDQVIAANQKIFDSVETISVYFGLMAEIDSTVFTQLSIVINNHTIVKVVDIITFDQEGKICKISAYKQ
jgi:hypothetical protein